MRKTECKECSKEFKVYDSWIKRGRGIFCSKSCYSLAMTKRIGIKNPNFLKNTTNYSSIHNWLRRTYGSADRCENKNCMGKSKAFDWALLKGKKYKRIRKNFILLCRSCHLTYDMTQERKNRQRARLIKNPIKYWLGKKRNMKRDLTGRFLKTNV